MKIGNMVKASPRDVSSLARLKGFTKTTFQQPQDYVNRVVLKPWGYEFLVFENEHVAIWFLYLGGGHSTSMHCHPEKRTSLIVLEGEAQCSFFNHRENLQEIGSVQIDKAVFHSTKSISETGIKLIEVETPPNKTDLVRLNDEYGRQSQGYEGLAEMVSHGIESYGYFNLNEKILGRQDCAQKLKNCVLRMMLVNTKEELRQVKWRETDFYLSCGGQLLNSVEQVILDVGNIERGSDLVSAIPESLIKGPLLLIHFDAEI